MPRATAPTLLSLSEYARLLGLDPVHFNQGFSELRPEADCSDVWYQYDWQHADRVSRDYLAELIANAEQDIADALGYWPAPVWIYEERHLYPKPRSTDVTSYYGLNARGEQKSIFADWGYTLAGGTRATTLLATPSYTPLDEDGDGYAEWAVFVFNVPTGTDPCEVKAYFVDTDRTGPSSVGADPSWEVRPIYATCDGIEMTVRVPRWELLRPHLQEVLNPTPIDADELANHVTNLEFYRVYTDPETQALFGWADEPCDSPACCYATQIGCIRVADHRRGTIVSTPATYDSTTHEFASASWADRVDPDLVWIYYRAGWLPLRANRRGLCGELDPYWARTIVLLATARLDRPLCTCTNIEDRVDRLRADMVFVKSETGLSKSYQIDAAVLQNPFGTRVGEVEAWKRVKGKRIGDAVEYVSR